MDTMTLEQVYYIGEIVAAFAIIVSLIYVGLQVRQNTQIMQVSAAQAHITAYNNLLGNLVQSQELANIYSRALKNFSTLKEDEVIQFWAFLGIMFRNFEAAHMQWQSGALDDRLLRGVESAMIDVFACEGAHQFWQARRHWYSDEFQNWFESTVAKQEAHEMYPAQEAAG